MPAPALHEAYYAHAEGRWDGTFTLEIHDAAAFRSAPLRPWGRLGIWAMSWTEALWGPAALTTVVRRDVDRRLVHHTAVLRRFGWALYRARRTFRLHDDGVSLTVTGDEHLWPFVGRPRSLEPGHARTEAPRRTRYRLPMLDTVWDVSFVLEDAAARSEVTCAWGRGVELLERTTPTWA